MGQGEPLDSLKQEGGWLSSVRGPKPISLKVRGTWREHSRQLEAVVPAHKRNCGRSVGGMGWRYRRQWLWGLELLEDKVSRSHR